jgi:hypothetical protein
MSLVMKPPKVTVAPLTFQTPYLRISLSGWDVFVHRFQDTFEVQVSIPVQVTKPNAPHLCIREIALVQTEVVGPCIF